MVHEFMTKTFGPFKGWKLYSKFNSIPHHFKTNGGTHARDERAIGKPLYSQLLVKYLGGGSYLLEQSDGYSNKIVCIGRLNKVLYKSDEIVSQWTNEVVTDYKNGYLKFN